MFYFRPSEIRVENSSGYAIPDYGIAQISEYKFRTSPYYVFQLIRPDSDNLPISELVYVRHSIADDGIGIGRVGDFFWAVKTAGETIAVGDKVGTDTDEFTVIKIADNADGTNDGQFVVWGIDSELGRLLLRCRTIDSFRAST